MKRSFSYCKCHNVLPPPPPPCLLQPNTDRDTYGNSALHMAVIHEQQEMYDFLVDMCGASVNVSNHAGLTPLVLAAQLGKMDMFKHITSRRRRTFYSFGRVSGVDGLRG